MVVCKDALLDAVFSALGNSTRRKILLHLRDGFEAPASILAEPLPISLQGIIKHLSALEHAGLVGQRKQGRERLYWLLPESLEIANAWLDDYEAFWEIRLDSLNAHITTESPDEG